MAQQQKKLEKYHNELMVSIYYLHVGNHVMFTSYDLITSLSFETLRILEFVALHLGFRGEKRSFVGL